MDWKNLTALVFGAGVSGISAAEVLVELGASVTLADGNPREKIKQDLSGIESKVTMALGRQDEALLEGIDLFIVSPGVSIYHPFVDAAKRRSIPVWSEVELAARLCCCEIFAVTGTNGKTTTTTLLGEMVRSCRPDTVVGGNIGLALSKEMRHVSPSGRVVAEISSFQLEAVHTFRPHVAVVLNLTPDHLDRHRTMAEYSAVKERIFSQQTSADWLVLNADDPTVLEMGKRAHSRIALFSRLRPVEHGAFVSSEGMIVVQSGERTERICAVSEMKLFGAHNVENALAASAAAWLGGVPAPNIAHTLQTFAGVEHRIEPVATVRGIRYFNDSKATNPESTVKALEAFDGHLILIAGGRDKNTSLDEMMRLVVARVDALILIGEGAERFGAVARKTGITNVHFAATLEEAVQLAAHIAVPPNVVLLSPACASYDMFDNYEQRGRRFKECVRQLEGCS